MLALDSQWPNIVVHDSWLVSVCDFQNVASLAEMAQGGSEIADGICGADLSEFEFRQSDERI